MHKERALRFLMNEMDYTDMDAAAKWKLIDSLTPEDERDYDGPVQSKLQLPIPTEKYVEGSTASAHEKECNLETKTPKITSQLEIDKARADVSTGLASFSDGMYADTGGSYLANLGKIGISFGEKRADRSNETAGFGCNLLVDNTCAKKKHYELGPGRVNLEEYIQTGIVDLSSKLKDLWAKCASADEFAEAATGGEGLDGLESWRSLLAKKMSWLRAVGHAITLDPTTYDCAQEQSVPSTMDDTDFVFITGLNASVLAAVTSLGGNAQAPDHAEAAAVQISKVATDGDKDLSSSVALPVLTRFGWTGVTSADSSGFVAPLIAFSWPKSWRGRWHV